MHPAMVLVVAVLALSALVAAENHDACAVDSANNPPQTCVEKLRQDEGPPPDRRRFNYCGYMNQFLKCYPKSCCNSTSVQREIQEEKDKYKDKTVSQFSLHCACWHAGFCTFHILRALVRDACVHVAYFNSLMYRTRAGLLRENGVWLGNLQ